MQQMSHKNIFKFAFLGAVVLSIVACGEAEEEVLVYESVEACIKAGERDEAVCNAEFAKAQKLHNEVAPSYRAAGDCYSDFGYNRCNQHRRSNGTSVWLPFMMGYMLAPRYGMSVMSQPLYRTTSDPNRYYTAGTGRVGAVSANGRSQVAKSQTRSPVRTRTVARGGFGARARGGMGAGG